MDPTLARSLHCFASLICVRFIHYMHRRIRGGSEGTWGQTMVSAPCDEYATHTNLCYWQLVMWLIHWWPTHCGMMVCMIWYDMMVTASGVAMYLCQACHRRRGNKCIKCNTVLPPLMPMSSPAKLCATVRATPYAMPRFMCQWSCTCVLCCLEPIVWY